MRTAMLEVMIVRKNLSGKHLGFMSAIVGTMESVKQMGAAV